MYFMNTLYMPKTFKFTRFTNLQFRIVPGNVRSNIKQLQEIQSLFLLIYHTMVKTILGSKVAPYFVERIEFSWRFLLPHTFKGLCVRVNIVNECAGAASPISWRLDVRACGWLPLKENYSRFFFTKKWRSSNKVILPVCTSDIRGHTEVSCSTFICQVNDFMYLLFFFSSLMWRHIFLLLAPVNG